MAGKRALGINAVMAANFEAADAYGTPPVTDFYQVPFVSSQLGEERGLIEDDQLGFGREGLDPTYDVANNDGDVVVPVDTRAIGFWLKLLMGDPVTAAVGHAAGFFNFSAQPTAASTITVAGTAFSFVVGSPTGNQIQIGADITATRTAIAAALNASAVGAVAAATYTVSGTKITATVDAAGPAGNAFTLAASGTSNATVSGPKLTGGTNSHTFSSGADDLPSASIEIGMPEVPDFAMNYGALANQFKVSMGRSGMLNATLSLICQGELPGADETAGGDLVVLRGPRFAQATGFVELDGEVLGDVVTADIAYSNNYDKNEVIKADGRIDGADATDSKTSGSINVKYSSRALKAKAENQEPVSIILGWTKGSASLTLTQSRVFLPKVKNPITGAKGIVAAYQYQASGAEGAQLVAVLVNDVVDY